MRIPRDLTGADISKAPRVLGYEKVRQDGSHLRLTTMLNGVHQLGRGYTKVWGGVCCKLE